LLYDNQKDPYQTRNLIGDKRYLNLQAELDKKLYKILEKTNDEFLSGDEYIKRHGYIIRPYRVYASAEEMEAEINRER